MERLRIALTMVRNKRFMYEETQEGVSFSYRRKSYKIDAVLRTNLDGNNYYYEIIKCLGRTHIIIPII